MTTTAIAQAERSSGLVWERLMTETRYGRYADRVEASMIEHLLSWASAPGVLLDVGCEGGRWSKVFADRGWQIIATDVDLKSLEACKARIPQAQCVVADSSGDRLPAKDQSIDVALCIEVAPVIHSSWAANEFARVLKPGARLAGVCWNRASWRGFFYHHAPSLRSTGSHPLIGFPIRYIDFRKQMIGCGFSFERELGYAWGPFRRTSNSRLVTLSGAFERLSGLQHLISVAPMVSFVCRKLPTGRPDRLYANSVRPAESLTHF
jgi:SAM-dependent methyltransferase